MNASKYQIVPLPSEVAEAARQVVKTGATDHALVTADAPTGYPCRHCLRWAQPGEELVLFPYASIPSGRPYSESGPIFVHRERCRRYEATDEYPEEFRQGRVLRVYNSRQEMIAAEALEGEPETLIEKFLANPETDFLQARSADRGCYTFAIRRA